MRKKKLKRIALLGWPVVTGRVLPFHSAILLHQEKTPANWEVVLGAESSINCVQLLTKLHCDGALVRLTSEEMAQTIRKAKFPVVNVSAWLADPGVPTVIFDEQARGRLAAEHLLERGFERFASLIVPGGWYIGQRNQGFQTKVVASGFGTEEFALSDLDPGKREFDRLVAWLKSLTPPFGVLCTDDPAAPVLIRACQRARLHVPHDVAIVGTVDREDICLPCDPQLSSVGPDENAIAEVAVKLLGQLMESQSTRHTDSIYCQPEGVIERASTDTLAVDDRVVAGAIQFMREHLSEGINVGHIVRNAPVSRITLERNFRRLLGRTPGQLLNELRVRRAKELLAEGTQMQMQDIAEICGFSDRNHLLLVFRRLVGVTPQQFRVKRSQVNKK